MTAGLATLATTWGLCLLQFLTVLPAPPFIVAEPAFREASGQRLYLPLGDMHWNRMGHAVAGKALALALTSRPPA